MRISITDIKIKDRIRKDLGDLTDKEIDKRYESLSNAKKIARAAKDLRRSSVSSEAKKMKQREIANGLNHCQMCGFDFAEILQIHHVVPIKDGGNNNTDNVVVVCPNCHKTLHKAYEYLRKDNTDEMNELLLHMNSYCCDRGVKLFLNCVVKYGERWLLDD